MKWQIQLPSVSDKETVFYITVNNKDSVELLFSSF